ncbi:MAG: hypothetical protein NC489_34365, partial [Ruminococcus flavefaciens]|nr:hypothetical protein [Ruminococcus flavefaciens]
SLLLIGGGLCPGRQPDHLFVWKGWKLPSSYSVPNSSSVLFFGVSVKEEKAWFLCQTLGDDLVH